MKVILNDFTNYLNKNANDDIFMNMEIQLTDVLSKKGQQTVSLIQK